LNILLSKGRDVAMWCSAVKPRESRASIATPLFAERSALTKEAWPRLAAWMSGGVAVVGCCGGASGPKRRAGPFGAAPAARSATAILS
jgi:hypothetical protein